MTLRTLARLINEQFPQWIAEVSEGQCIHEKEWKGHSAVLKRWTAKGNMLTVRDRSNPFKKIYECNLAKYWVRAKDAAAWFIEQGGKIEGR